MIPSGRARLEQEIIDLSVIVGTGVAGVNAVLGVTERGEIGKTVLVGSWAEFTRNFGGLIADSDFPLICRRALERGGKLRVSRVGHYTDINDKTTLVGVKAVTSVVGTGTLLFVANSVGLWGNNLTVELYQAASGAAANFDIKVTLEGYPELTQIITNINEVITIDDINRFNAASLLVAIDPLHAGETIVAGVKAFTTGAFDTSTITATDYTGSAAGENGIYSFDNAVDFVKIAVPEMAVPAIDIALITYARSRQDCRAVLRTPVGISGLTALDYRERTGAYSGALLDDWYGSMVFGTLEVTHPDNGGKVTIPAIGDVLGAMSYRDNNSYPWYAVAGSKRGRLKSVLSVQYNLGSAARSGEFDQLDSRGVNVVIDDRDFGPVIWGNSTLSKANTLLKHENVADLMVYLTRGLGPLIKSELFEPNDIDTWKNIHRKVRPFLEAIKDKRGLWDYLYQGDQLIDDIAEAQINTPQNIDAGQYILHIWVQPKVALKYVGVKVVVTNTGISFEELTGQPVN